MDKSVAFQGQIVLVTGASRGIGKAVANLFAQNGARVAVHYHRDRQAAEQVVSNLAGSGHMQIAANIADAASALQLVAAVVDKMGGLDVLVNNAGVYTEHPIAECDYGRWRQAWQQTLDLNLIGPANLIFCATDAMRRRGGGRIVNVSSRGAFRGEPDAPAYGASKAGLNALSQSMAKALAADKIFVTAVAPGFVETDMVTDLLEGAAGDAIRAQSPLGRVATPEEVARTVLFLAAEESAFLTGAVVDVNGASYLR